MAHRLRSDETPAMGMVAGPTEHPDRYKLLSCLSPLRHPRLSPDRAPSVWLAQEQSSGFQVVLKVIRDDADGTFAAYETEPARLWRIAGYNTLQTHGAPLIRSDHPGQDHCVRILDFFHLPWKDGTEVPGEDDIEDISRDVVVCLEQAGPTLAVWRDALPSRFLPARCVRSIVHQLLQAVDYLQRGIKGRHIVHAGICLEHILLSQPTDLAAFVAEHRCEAPTIKLVGFGSSEDHKDEDYSDRTCAGSEETAAAEQILLGACYGHYGCRRSIDVWAVGVVASQLLFDINLALNGLKPYSYKRSDWGDVLQQYSTSAGVVVALASIDPEAGWPKWVAESVLQEPVANFPFHLPNIHPLPPLKDRIEAQGKLEDPQEVEQLTSFLKACWVLDPLVRPSAQELLAHEWLKDAK